MWPRVDGLRALELGSPGEMRERLNALVLAGAKRATAGLAQEYDEEGEALEFVGERLALLDSAGERVATVEVTGVTTHRFVDVPWEFALAEGEGDESLDEWRDGHRRYWRDIEGRPVTDDSPVVCLRFRLV
ncbi:ASCH domain-containing protein [Luedemannella flava]|uniref:ASCH domain-containing protein n=1 Tax=Luedemannella flava TaxID=349316 RepID=UPI0031CFB179